MPKVTILIMPFVLIGILEARTYVDAAVITKGLRAISGLTVLALTR